MSLLGAGLKTHIMWAEWAYAKVKIHALLKAIRFFSSSGEPENTETEI